MRVRALVGLVAALSLLLVGCSDEETPGQPSTLTPEGPSESTPGGNPGEVPADAPKVATPIAALDKFMQAPCDMVSKEQAAELGFDAKIEPESDTSQGPGCQWDNEAGDNFAIVLLKNQPLGIGGIYQNHAQFPEADAYFEPVDVAGFPGVFGEGYDARPNGSCVLSVGVTDQQIIVLTNRISGSDPCPDLKSAAEAAVQTMSKG